MKKEYIKPVSGMHSFKIKAIMNVISGPGMGEDLNEGELDSKGMGGSSMWEYMEMEEE